MKTIDIIRKLDDAPRIIQRQSHTSLVTRMAAMLERSKQCKQSSWRIQKRHGTRKNSLVIINISTLSDPPCGKYYHNYLSSPAITPLLLTRLTYVPSFISSENVKRASDDEPCTSLYLLVKSDSFLSAFQGTPVFAAKCSAVLRPCYSMRISISWRWLDRSNMAAQLTYLRTVNASSSFLYMPVVSIIPCKG